MKTISNHSIRIIYSLISVLLMIFSYFLSDHILDRHSKPLDVFSYIGTVATIVALIVAVSEILHSIKSSSAAINETNKILRRVRNFDYASSTSECQQYLDDVNSHVNIEEYLIALKSFQHFRIVYSKFSFEISGRADIDIILSITESLLYSGVQSNVTSPLTKRQKRSIIENVLKIKDILQREISQYKEKNVSS